MSVVGPFSFAGAIGGFERPGSFRLDRHASRRSRHVAYVLLARDRLPGPGWLRGLIFVQVPGALQLLWVLPALGHGLGGGRISAATPLLAWSLNAFFGIVVGAIAARAL